MARPRRQGETRREKNREQNAAGVKIKRDTKRRGERAKICGTRKTETPAVTVTGAGDNRCLGRGFRVRETTAKTGKKGSPWSKWDRMQGFSDFRY